MLSVILLNVVMLSGQALPYLLEYPYAFRKHSTSFLVESHLAVAHLTNRHLTNRHLTNRHLANRQFADTLTYAMSGSHTH